MPQNLELKIKLKSFDKIIELLKNIKATYVKELKQKDVYYKTPGKLLKLRIENGEPCLIKYNRDEKGENRFSNYKILYFKSENVEGFLSDIFKIEMVVQKRRRLYLFDNTRIHLDVVRKLGKFLELETLVINDKEDSKYRFNTIIEKLQLDTSNQIRKSYINLMKEFEKAK